MLKAGETRRLLDTVCATQFTRLSQASVFHNLCRDQHEIIAPPLVCTRSGHLRTICSDVTQRKDFITTSQTVISQYSAEL